MKKILLVTAFLTLAASQINAQSTCNNQDFEDTTYTNWTGATGFNSSILNPVTWVNGIITTGINAPLGDVNSRMSLITNNFYDSTVLDPNTLMPDTLMTSLAPNGGSVSLRLGNNNINFECEKVMMQFAVTSSNPVFQYQFASVLEEPGHLPNEQPYLLVNMFDQSMNIIPSGTDSIWSGNPNYPFISSTSVNSMAIMYRRWTPVSVDLSAYIGQTVTIEFVNSDCALGGHFGYTYIDISCMGAPIVNVWPGDTDYDLQCNNVDLIPLAIALNSTGTARAGASNNWVAQPSADWSQSFAFNMNYKHSDCNGDGIVDLNDTLAITQNYGQTHPFRLGNPGNDLLSTPMLYLVPVADTVPSASFAYVNVFIGYAGAPIHDLAGIAFDFNYDNAFVQPSTVEMNFSGSLLGTKNVDMISLSRDFWSGGAMEVGMSKTGGAEVDGYGYLGQIKLRTNAVTTMTNLGISLSDVHAFSGQFTNIPVVVAGPEIVKIVIDPDMPAGISAPEQINQFSFYPNPANETVMINTAAEVHTITITDALGREILRTQNSGTQTQISLNGIASGVYFINVISEKGKSTQQLVVTE